MLHQTFYGRIMSKWKMSLLSTINMLDILDINYRKVSIKYDL